VLFTRRSGALGVMIARMETIRLRDPWQGRAARRLEFGSSEWAADSCLADWSTLERQWLGPMPKRHAGPALPGWLVDFAGQLLAALFRLALLALAAASMWGVLAVLPRLLPA
jgi:hypothetical protein